jgi:hypothetical protein
MADHAALGALVQAGREPLDRGTYGFWDLAMVGSATAHTVLGSTT